MSPSVDDLESRWLDQLRSMREAIAELKLDQQDGEGQAYGHDMVIEDDVTGRSSSEDIWDVWSGEDETEDSSGFIDGYGQDRGQSALKEETYSQDWLRQRCSALALSSSGLDSGHLEEQISVLLASDMQGIYHGDVLICLH